MKKLPILIFCFLGLSACKEKETSPKASINPVFKPYFNKFLVEGQKRGVTFTEKELAITIQLSGLIQKKGSSGYADYETRTIDIDSSWLQYPDDVLKEMLLFHELGHLLLQRTHNLLQLPNGEPSSLMWTFENNTDRCSAPLFTGNLRQTYYLDELFKPNTGPPTWITDNVVWKEPTQNAQTAVVGENSLNRNVTLDSFVSTNSNIFSYQLLPKGMSLIISKQLANAGFKVPLATLFPNLAEIPLKNYEVRMRYKLNGRGFNLNWTPNNQLVNSHFLTSDYCGEPNYMGILNNRGGFFINKKTIQNLSGVNDLILQHKDNYIMIWLNGKLLFQTDLTVNSTLATPLDLILNFGASQYDFEFITVTKL